VFAVPLRPFCHDVPDGTLPKAKRSRGHYGIDSLVQKVRAKSTRTFEADYLCKGPRADGLWFPSFNATTSVDDRAEFDPPLPLNISVDSGLFTGAVFFQVARIMDSIGYVEEIRVFADCLEENRPAEHNA
jgi:hypothetical protein